MPQQKYKHTLQCSIHRLQLKVHYCKHTILFRIRTLNQNYCQSQSTTCHTYCNSLAYFEPTIHLQLKGEGLAIHYSKTSGMNTCSGLSHVTGLWCMLSPGGRQSWLDLWKWITLEDYGWPMIRQRGEREIPDDRCLNALISLINLTVSVCHLSGGLSVLRVWLCSVNAIWVINVVRISGYKIFRSYSDIGKSCAGRLKHDSISVSDESFHNTASRSIYKSFVSNQWLRAWFQQMMLHHIVMFPNHDFERFWNSKVWRCWEPPSLHGWIKAALCMLKRPDQVMPAQMVCITVLESWFHYSSVCSILRKKRVLLWNDWSYLSIRHSHWTKFTKSDWFVHVFFVHRCCCCNVLGSQSAYPSTETNIAELFFTCYF